MTVEGNENCKPSMDSPVDSWARQRAEGRPEAPLAWQGGRLCQGCPSLTPPRPCQLSQPAMWCIRWDPAPKSPQPWLGYPGVLFCAPGRKSQRWSRSPSPLSTRLGPHTPPEPHKVATGSSCQRSYSTYPNPSEHQLLKRRHPQWKYKNADKGRA